MKTRNLLFSLAIYLNSRLSRVKLGMTTAYFFGKELCLSYGWKCIKQLKATVYTAVLVGKFYFFFCMDLVNKGR